VTTLEEGWRQLHPRTVVVTVLTVAGILAGVAIPIIIGVLDDGDAILPILLIAIAGIVVVSAVAAFVDTMRYRHTTYRVTDERIELRYSWVLHKRRSVPRERVRTVDLTANPLQRVFGLAKVKIGTGQQTRDSGSHLTLDPVDKAVAEELRRLLLHREAAPSVEQTPGELAKLDWRWIRFAPISVTTPILGAAAFGAIMQVSEWFNAQGAVFRLVRYLFEDLSAVGLVGALVVIGVVVGIVGSLGLFVEMWFRYRLTREDGNLLMTRGLLNTRSLTLEQRRLRGVELVEGLGVRMLGAARVDVVATGMSQKSDDDKTDPKTVLPAAPFEVARRVATEVLGSPAATATSLVAHPRAARARRLRAVRRRGAGRGARGARVAADDRVAAPGVDPRGGADAGRGAPGARGVPQPGARPRVGPPRDPARGRRAADRRVAAHRRHRVDDHPVAVPAPGRPDDHPRDDRREQGRLPGVRHRRGGRSAFRRRGGAGAAHAVPGTGNAQG